jgi:hypothetical protein
MPKPELAYTIFVGLPVTGITVLFAAVNWAVEQGVVWNAGTGGSQAGARQRPGGAQNPGPRGPDAGVG